MISKDPHICIGLGTFERPKMLQKALESLAKLNSPENTKITLLLCDNEPQMSAKDTYERLKGKLSIDSTYLHEPRKGLVRMRNRILDEANMLQADFLAFFDDDEEADENWVTELYKSAVSFQAQAVGGPVIVKWPDESQLDEFMKGLYDNDRVVGNTGDIRKTLATNNVIIDLNFLRKKNIIFDIRFNLMGGEDTFLFDAMREAGAKLIWCNEALMYTKVVPERNNEAFIWKRRYRIGQTKFFREEMLHGRKKAILKLVPKAIEKTIIEGLCYYFVGRERRIRGKERLLTQKGVIDAILGRDIDIYTDTDGH